jgi:hypothetical protein
MTEKVLQRFKTLAPVGDDEVGDNQPRLHGSHGPGENQVSNHAF